jgi:hypothetical protein
MATRIYGVSPGAAFQINSIVEAVGPTATSAPIALVIDLTATLVTDGGTTRAVSKEEVLLAIENIKAYILAGNWTPA